MKKQLTHPAGSVVPQIKSAKDELVRCRELTAYEAVNVAWIAIVKLANLLPGHKEEDRLGALRETIPADRKLELLHHPAVEVLITLDPPLESVMGTNHNERIKPHHTREQLLTIKSCRSSDPNKAFNELFDVLRRIRNRREHGFKTPRGPRDSEILGAAEKLLLEIGAIAVDTMTARMA